MIRPREKTVAGLEGDDRAVVRGDEIDHEGAVARGRPDGLGPDPRRQGFAEEIEEEIEFGALEGTELREALPPSPGEPGSGAGDLLRLGGGELG